MAVPTVLQDHSGTLASVIEEPRLSYEENWKLIFEMFGSGKELFAEFGGGEAFLRAERAAWAEQGPA